MPGIFQLYEFVKAPRGPYAFDFWVHPVLISSVLGLFAVELLPDIGEPDLRMVNEAERLVSFMQAHPDKLLDKVYEHYRGFDANLEWLASRDVPENLKKDELPPYLMVRDIVVIRDENMQTLRSCFYISPQWDKEHAIYLELRGIKLEYCEC